MPRQQQLLHPAAAVLVACAVVTVLFTAGFLAQHIDFTKEEPAAASPAATEAPIPGVGEAVRDGKLEFVVSRVDCSRFTIGIEHLKRTAKGKYCVVDLAVRNITADESQVFLGHAQKAHDVDGTSHRYDEMASLYADPNTRTLVHKLGAGERIKVKLVFDIPGTSVLTMLELHDSPLSGGAEVTLG
jgi:hypothetical protein